MIFVTTNSMQREAAHRVAGVLSHMASDIESNICLWRLTIYFGGFLGATSFATAVIASALYSTCVLSNLASNLLHSQRNKTNTPLPSSLSPNKRTSKMQSRAL